MVDQNYVERNFNNGGIAWTERATQSCRLLLLLSLLIILILLLLLLLLL